MPFLSSIYINYSNIISITISENLDDLLMQPPNLLENYWDIQNYKVMGFRSDSPTSILYDSLNNNVTLSPLLLKEEKTYYLCLQYDKNLEVKKIFLDPFVNNSINWLPSSLFKNESGFINQFVGSFKTKNYVGTWDFSLVFLNKLLIDIVPNKIDFEEDYKLITENISNEICELTTRFGSLNQLNFEENYTSSNQYIESIHLKNIVNNLCQNIDIIMRYPYIKTSEYYEIVPMGTQIEADLHEFIAHFNEYNWVNDGPVASIFRGCTPLDINSKIKLKDIDNFPNRYVKHVLNYCLEISYDILYELKEIHDKSKSDLIRMQVVQNWIYNLEERLYSSFFSCVGSLNTFYFSSQVLEKKMGYQDIALLYDKLQTSLIIDWNPEFYNENMYYSRPIYDLYEIWCYFKVKECIENICGNPINQTLVSTTHNRIKFNLSRGSSGKITYNYNNTHISLYYNKNYPNSLDNELNTSYTIPYKPDITIEISGTNGQIELHHFDAKYKTNNNGSSYKEEDIHKMHAYKDGIRNSKSASILYPGSNLEQFRINSKEFINTVPCRPGTALDNLQLIIREIIVGRIQIN